MEGCCSRVEDEAVKGTAEAVPLIIRGVEGGAKTYRKAEFDGDPGCGVAIKKQ